MKELIFNVEFLSDIVLPASSNTEGNIEQLDFIPGSNFLGMVAREYSDFTDSFNVFHSGAVRFGDATLLLNSEATYKMPLSFFHEKEDSSKRVMVNHHLIEDFSEFKQLKQKRKGYITQNLQEVSLDYNYAQKSAYDKNERRSKEGSMYGYSSIPAGTMWQFSVKYDEVNLEDIERIVKNLVGKRRLGKSKSSQYGQVMISEASKVEGAKSNLVQGTTTMVYLKSRVALVDTEGNPTYDLKYLLDGLEESNIVWEKSQIKTSIYMPYNGAMKTKTYSRVVINSGSVIILHNLSSEQLERLEKGVGVYLNEGFGELLINPNFLKIEDKFLLNPLNAKEDDSPLAITEDTVQFLKNREMKKRETLDLVILVHDFVKNYQHLYRNISNSQWGTIRSICSGSSSNFRDEIHDYISDGKVTWTIEQIESLLEEGKSRAFIQLLTMQMPKVRGEK